MKNCLQITVLAAICMLVSCEKKPNDAGNNLNNEAIKMTDLMTLEKMLAEGQTEAVEMAEEMGEQAWPAILKAAKMENYESRQLAMYCAGSLEGPQAGEILTLGLSDDDVNVRSAAASQLMDDPPENAKTALLHTLSQKTERSHQIPEMLALGAGFLPGDDTVEVLKGLLSEGDDLAENAKMALAKLGDQECKNNIIGELSDNNPFTRYNAVKKLEYIDDPGTFQHVVKLLNDRAEAVNVGTSYRSRYRRVCDQAVDSVIYLLELEPPFEINVTKIYSDSEILQLREMIQKKK